MKRTYKTWLFSTVMAILVSGCCCSDFTTSNYTVRNASSCSSCNTCSSCGYDVNYTYSGWY